MLDCAILVWNEIGEDPTDRSQAKLECDFVHEIFLCVFQKFDAVARCHLWWFVDGCHLCLDSERNGFVVGVRSVHNANALVSSLSPVVEEPVDDEAILKLNVVNVSVFLN